ncbi:MAG TPA: hypothetical protein VFS00_33510 [Polyangiaceae bacterium]|nr:hypothetical protein [Polyangiaceae bacterium]
MENPYKRGLSPSSPASLAVAGAALALLVAACGASDADAPGAAPDPLSEGPRPLARAEHWRAASLDEDPAAGGVAPGAPCGERDWRVEGEAVEVSTGACGYVALAQPTLHDVAAGDAIVVRAWWSVLDAPAPATGRLALFLGGEPLWQELVPIPGRPDAREARVTSPIDAKAGTPLVFHLSNHGSNAWTLAEVSLAASASNASKP